MIKSYLFAINEDFFFSVASLYTFAAEVFNFKVSAVSCPYAKGRKIAESPTFGINIYIFGNEKASVYNFNGITVCDVKVSESYVLTVLGF